MNVIENYAPQHVQADSTDDTQLFIIQQPINLAEFTGIAYLWLDELVTNAKQEYNSISQPASWRFFSSLPICATFIRTQCKDKRVFLISFGRLGESPIKAVHPRPQLHRVYIYCGDVQRNLEWAAKFDNVGGVYNDEKNLIPQLTRDVAQTLIEIGDAYIQIHERFIC
ncbi:unnamed protein product [Didymodactylos carnosus]|uniref:Uncharacterized protein n=1 Tax=Didymodactylos carnosus TaxID=1234261 RepID=A0A8S2DFD4_9BILA|nr:unnamed protein product [Didymodactylos carnosus]CAF3693864.1 unnamed protein product [Didymodactylos carnosus]